VKDEKWKFDVLDVNSKFSLSYTSTAIQERVSKEALIRTRRFQRKTKLNLGYTVMV
jgi:hypothetical protein